MSNPTQLPIDQNALVYSLSVRQVATIYNDMVADELNDEPGQALVGWEELPPEDQARFIKAAEVVCEHVEVGEALGGVLGGMLYRNRRAC